MREIDPERGYGPGLTDALKRLREGRHGPVTENDRPPPSTFPLIPAARAVLQLARQRPP